MPKTKPDFAIVPSTEHHWFATSAGAWRTGNDPVELVRLMKLDRLTFSLWLVPGPETAAYRIQYFAPQVDGAKQVATYELT